MKNTPKKKIKLMTWMAIERDPSLFANVLRVVQEQYEVEHIYYLYTNGTNTKTDTLALNVEYMEHKYAPILEPIPIEISNPSSLEELYEKTQDALKPRLRLMNNLIICTTAGTPAMYATWVLLYAGGFFPTGTELFSAQRPLKKGKELFKDKTIEIESSQKLQKINFKVSTFLSQIRKLEKKAYIPGLKHTYDLPKSPKGREAHNNILRFSQIHGVPLLIYGERGVGKSTAVNEWIYNLKKVIKGKEKLPIVTINCSSLDPNLAESRIFGYVPGAFTGAQKNGAEGLIEQARNGILFLDEIQDLRKEVQRKLLKVFNDHHYTKLGDSSNTEKEIQFDLICATNNSEQELKQKLDLDFYDRICVYKVTFPPLRERREDIPDLWRDTWKDVCRSTGQEDLIGTETLSEDLNTYFKTANLYGNIRTLRKIAFLKIAWMNEKNDKEILDMIEDDETESEVQPNSSDSFFSKYENLSWNEANVRFRRDLALWSEQKYGSFSSVENRLGWKIRNLQNALKEKKQL